MADYSRILMGRGLKEYLPEKLSIGEFVFADDTEELFIGGRTKNIEIPTKKELDAQLDKKVSDGGYGEWTPKIYGTDGIIPEQVGSGTYRIIGKTAKLRGHIALSSTNDMAGANLINTPFPIIHREPQAMGTVIMGNFSTPIGYSFPVIQTTSSSIISVAWCGSEELKISRLYGVSLRDNTTIYFDIDVELP